MFNKEIKDLKEKNENLERDVNYLKRQETELREKIANNKRQNELDKSETERVHKHEIEDLQRLHDSIIKDKEFEMKHFKDEEMLKAKEVEAKAIQELEVIKKENEFLHKLIDTNAAIIDVKNLVSQLISKLPNIDIKSLQVSNSNSED